MKLNFDCIREVLLTLEEITGFNETGEYFTFQSEEISEKIEKYSKDDVYYSLLKLNEAGYIKCKERFVKERTAPYLTVWDITYNGHTYLNSVRNEKIWAKIKTESAALTFSLITKIAEKLIISQLF